MAAPSSSEASSPRPGSSEWTELWSAAASISRLHIVGIAALGCFTFGWLFTGVYPLWVVLVCAFDWFTVNLLNRVVDLEEDRTNAIAGTRFVARRRRPILMFGLGLLAVSFLLVHAVAPWLSLARLAFHGLGMAYNWPLLPGRRRIKELYFWKNTASSVGFLLTVFLYPLLASATLDVSKAGLPGISIATLGTTMLFFFLFELSYEVIYDLRDVAGDAAIGAKTYPVVHGEAGAVLIIDGLLLAAMLVLISGWLLGVVPWRITIMAAAPALQWVLYKRWLPRGISSRDCILLTWLGAALLLTYHVWVWAGLPGVGLT